MAKSDSTVAVKMTVKDVRTGEVKDIDESEARRLIGCGDVIETVPSSPARALQWRKDLLARVVDEAKHYGYSEQLKTFEEYAAWCQSHGFGALPVVEQNLVFFLLSSAGNGVPDYILRSKVKDIGIIHKLTRHPPLNIIKRAWNGYNRALSFAKLKLSDSTTTLDLASVSRKKAFEMFPDGEIPMRWGDLA